MNDRVLQISKILADVTGDAKIHVSSVEDCEGGCISKAQRIELNDGREYFLKSNESDNAETMFATEAAGLAALGAVNAIRVPHLIHQGRLADGSDILLLECIRSERPSQNFFQAFGERLAQLHRNGVSTQYGWQMENFIGASPQFNTWLDSWVEFFRVHRLEAQHRMLEQRGLATPDLTRRLERLSEKLGELLAVDDLQPSLLHGDLWNGNFLCSTNQEPVVFDPAVYYGHREAELSLPVLFGGFPPVFWDAYQATWPLETGWRDRVEIYKLYHLLNHLLLFGGGYYDDCLRVLERFTWS
ncbi:MAG: fructosamine kinase family protein [Pirellulaceae bacterium]